MLALVLVGALQLPSLIAKGPELLSRAGEFSPIRSVEIETDGFLERDWLLDYLALGAEESLLTVDLAGLKSRLEALGQVDNAEVERRFPDTLVVSLQERQPIARIAGLRANGEKLALFVDRTGAVFECERIDPSLIRSLPFLDGIKLKKRNGGFASIPGIEPLAELLSEAQAIAPHLYRRWRIVSLEKSDRLIVRGRMAKQIEFDAGSGFRDQLGRLDYIIDHYRSLGWRSIEHVDLTLGDQVPVRSS